MNENKINAQTPYQFFFLKEKEMNMFSLQCGGVFYWQLIRFRLLKGITIKDLQVAGSSIKRNYKKEIIGVVKAAQEMRKKYKSLKHADIIRIRPCVTITKDGELDDHQYDYVKLKHTAYDLYALVDYSDINNCVKYDLAGAESKLVFWKIKRKIMGNKDFPSDQKKKLIQFLEIINGNYGTEFDIQNLEHHIFYSIACHKYYSDEFKKIFSFIQPKIIMVYPHYDEHMFAAINAARDLGIKSIEIQHGRINAHEAYWYEDQDSKGKILPDYFLTYGEWWNDSIKLPQFCKPIAVGNPYLDKQIEIYPKNKNENGLVILVFSNPQNGKVLSEFIYEIKDFVVNNNISILYKLHPNERKSWKNEYPCLSQMPNTRIIEDNTSAYSLMAKSNVAIGVNSTLFYEALAYSAISLYIYTVGDYEGMKPLIANGMAEAVRNKDEFVEKLRNKVRGKMNLVKEQFWKTEAEKNTLSFLDTIIAK